MSSTIKNDIQQSTDSHVIKNFIHLCLKSSVSPKVIHSWRNDWDEIIPGFDFECSECEGTGEVKTETSTSHVDEHGPWISEDNFNSECPKCWGRGSITWEDVPDVK